MAVTTGAKPKARDLRRMAGRAQDAERERKLLALADQLQEQHRENDGGSDDR